jgi:hypothetical protein
MLQVFHTDVAKGGSGCYICCNGCTRMFQASVPNVSFVFHTHVASVFIWMLHMFHTYVTSVLCAYCICLQWFLFFQVFFASVSVACFKFFICFFCMLQVLHLSVPKIDHMLLVGCTWELGEGAGGPRVGRCLGGAAPHMGA